MVRACRPTPADVGSEFQTDGDTSLLLCFGTDADRLDPNDANDVQAALKPLIPDVELVSCVGRDWVNDPYSRGTCAMLRPKQWTKLRELDQVRPPLFIAGSDFAEGCAGLMDGAIESGIVTARRVREFLAAGSHPRISRS